MNLMGIIPLTKSERDLDVEQRDRLVRITPAMREAG
jgi:hypothetical protein